MISAKSSTNGESLTRFEGIHCNHGRNSAGSPSNIYQNKFLKKIHYPQNLANIEMSLFVLSNAFENE
jgi:hypothetical protein